MSLLIFMLVLSFLVVIHELGHFLVAKWSGMRVEEFGFGYPPKMATIYKDKQGTEYTVNWLPFGGFVRLYGEDGEASVGQEKAKGAFFTKPVWKRMLVVLSGAVVNFVFGVVAFGAIYTYVGIPTEFDHVKVEQVVPGSPAAEAGLKAEDVITGYVTETEVVGLESADEFIEAVGQFRGGMMVLVLEGVEAPMEVYVRTVEETPEGQGSMGVVISSFGLVKYPLWQMPIYGMAVGLESAVRFGVMLVEALGGMMADLVTMGKVPQDVAGPVGIVHTVSREGILEEGWLAIVNFAAILSINLAIVNVMPFPALDGGRALFLAMEGVTGKRIKPKWERWINTVGFMMLISLIVMISVRDVVRVFQDEVVQNLLRRILPGG